MVLLDSSYWLFSTMTQSMAALFAVVGVFLVFKIQLLNERMRLLMEAAKSTYISLKRISADITDEKYRKVIVYTSEEMIAALKELITTKKNALTENREKLEEHRKQKWDDSIWTDNIVRIEKEISDCENRLIPLERINRNLIDIKNEGKNSLMEICSVFIASLILLFSSPFIPKCLILILESAVIIITIFITFQLAKIIITSLNTKEG